MEDMHVNSVGAASKWLMNKRTSQAEIASSQRKAPATSADNKKHVYQSVVESALGGRNTADDPGERRVICPYCKRRYKKNRFEDHKYACFKQFISKREIFDSSSQRLRGTKFANYHTPRWDGVTSSVQQVSSTKKYNWRIAHENCLKTIRSAREMHNEEKGNIRGRKIGVRNTAADLKKYKTDCMHCNRNFKKDRLENHKEFYLSRFTRIPEIFDSRSQRLSGIKFENYHTPCWDGVTSSVQQEISTKKYNWRIEHENFLRTIRNLKKQHYENKLTELPPPPKNENPDYIENPSCETRLNQRAAELDIPLSTNIPRTIPKTRNARGNTTEEATEGMATQGKTFQRMARARRAHSR